MSQIHPKTGEPLVFSKNSSNYFCYVHFVILWLIVSKRVSKIIIWRLNEKSVGLWVSLGLEQGNPLKFFQNTNKKLYVFCTNLFTYCIIKGIKVKKFWRWIKNVSAFDTDFLVWIMKKTACDFFFIDSITSMHEYVYKCAMVIWNYITQWFS